MSQKKDLRRGHRAEPAIGDELRERSSCRVCGDPVWRYHGAFANSNPWRHRDLRFGYLK